MDPLTPIFLVIISLAAILFRRPFQDFPLDDDFAIYTYRARFASQGFQWKKDLQIIGIPMWKMLLLDKLYGSKEGGVQRIRHLQTAFHLAGSLAIYGALWNFTHNPWASFTGGLLYSFYGTSPDLTAGSFNFEQFYIPFIFSGLAFLQAGPEWVILAGLCFGLATLPKYTTALFTCILAPLVWIEFGGVASAQFALTVAGVMALSNLTEWKMGFWDAPSRKQMKTRMATTLRLTRTKNMHFSILFEIGQLFKQALPVWLGLIPLGTYCVQNQSIWLSAFSLTLFSMIIFQRAFSRYHYLPLFGLLSLGCGLGMDAVLALEQATMILASFAALLAWNLKAMAFYYLRPTEPATLAHYEKFDQYLYLPRLGKILKRLMKMRGESGERIFVWGTFSQLYHLTDSPASDNFLHHTIGPWDTPDLEGFYDSFVGGLLRHRPKYLIKSFTDLDVQRLEEITGLRYKLLKVVLARFPVYRLESFKSVAKNPLTLPWQEKMRHMDSLTQGVWHAPGFDRSDADRGKPEIALKECRKVIKLNKLDVEGYDYMGEIYTSMGLTEQAETAFENVLKYAPDWPNTRLKLCDIKIELNKLDEALTLLNEETKRFGYDLKIAFLHGLLQKLNKNYAEALIDFEKIRRQEPDRHDCWQFSIECMQNLKDRDGLKNLHTEAWDVNDTKDREWLQTLIIKNIAQMDSSLRPDHETLDLYLQKNPENGILRYAFASALEKFGDRSGAYELFEELATSSKNYPHIQANAWFRMALLVSQDRQYQLLQQCLKRQPSHQGAKDLLNKKPQTTEVMQLPVQNSAKNTEKMKTNPNYQEGSPLKVSVVVPNWNGMRFVGMCLDSLAKLDFEDYEVIVVDNGSVDGSREMIEEQYPEVRLLKMPDNMGFAIACNEGIKASNAEYIVLLNNDIEVTPDWLRELYEGMERHPECGMGTTKMMFLDQRDVFYNTGDLFHSWSAGGGRGQGEKDIGQYEKEDYVFGACAGAGIYRREFFNQVGLFDEDFFIFAEDVDLNMRGQLQGLKSVYLPKAKVFHIGTATVGLYSDRYVYLCKRNDIWVFIKNYSLSMYFKYLYSIWKHQFTDIKYFTYRGQGQVLWKSKWDALKMLPQMLFRRLQIQQARTIPDSEIEEHIITD